MRNFKKLFFVLLLVCAMLLPNIVNAATKAKVVLECTDSEYDEKEEGVYCSVGLEIPEDETISFKSISFTLAKSYVGDVATFEAANDNIVVSGSFDNGFTITKKNNGTFSSSDTLLEIENITMPGIDKATYEKGQYNFNMKVTNVKLVEDDKNTYSATDYSNTIRLLSIDNTLSSISIDGTALAGFNPKASLYKYSTTNGTIKLSATASNQNATISVGTGNAVKKELKNKELSLPYGDTDIVITVTSESGVAKTYTIYAFRSYKLFPGYDFEFNSKLSTYKLNVGKDVTKFALCYYDESKNAFVKKDNVLCINTGVLEDVFGINPSSSKDSQTYYKTLKLNGTYVTADYASLSSKEIYDRMEIVTDADGNQTLYTILGNLKDGDNTLTFSVDELHPEYKVTINKGESSDATADGVGSGGDSSSNNGSTSNNGSSSNNGSTANGGSSSTNGSTSNSGNNTVADSTTENPKTGIVTYTLAILGLAAVAGGTYYFLRKKNIIKKI